MFFLYYYKKDFIFAELLRSEHVMKILLNN